MKRTFVVPDDKEDIYEKFKELVPEVSGKLMEYIIDVVNKHEAQQAGMKEQTTYIGSSDTKRDIFTGKVFKFMGVEIANIKYTNNDTYKVYLTLKRKLLVTFGKGYDKDKPNLSYEVFETYDDMVKSERVPGEVLRDCEKYLSKASGLRYYEELDV